MKQLLSEKPADVQEIKERSTDYIDKHLENLLRLEFSESSKEEYKNIVSSIPKRSRNQIIAGIGSDRFNLIGIASMVYGLRFEAHVADTYPDAKVFTFKGGKYNKIDMQQIQKLSQNADLFNLNRISGKYGSIEDQLNDSYALNGIPNMRFVEKNLEKDTFGSFARPGVIYGERTNSLNPMLIEASKDNGFGLILASVINNGGELPYNDVTSAKIEENYYGIKDFTEKKKDSEMKDHLKNMLTIMNVYYNSLLAEKSDSKLYIKKETVDIMDHNQPNFYVMRGLTDTIMMHPQDVSSKKKETAGAIDIQSTIKTQNKNYLEYQEMRHPWYRNKF